MLFIVVLYLCIVMTLVHDVRGGGTRRKFHSPLPLTCKFRDDLMTSTTKISKYWNEARKELGLEAKAFSYTELLFIRKFLFTTHGTSLFHMHGTWDDIDANRSPSPSPSASASVLRGSGTSASDAGSYLEVTRSKPLPLPAGEHTESRPQSPPKGHHDMGYMRLYKCANIKINTNLHKAAIGPPAAGSAVVLEELSLVNQENSVLYDLYVWWKGFVYRPPTFTFVREPIVRFASGYREYLDRCLTQLHLGKSRHPKDYHTRVNITVSFLRAQFRDILDGKGDQLHDCAGQNHIYPVAGAFRPYFNVQYIGKIESMLSTERTGVSASSSPSATSGWADVERQFGFHVEPFNNKIGGHQSSLDYNQFNPAFKALMEEDPRYKRALCRLLMIDFECFDYDLPPECEGMLPAGGVRAGHSSPYAERSDSDHMMAANTTSNSDSSMDVAVMIMLLHFELLFSLPFIIGGILAAVLASLGLMKLYKCRWRSKSFTSAMRAVVDAVVRRLHRNG